MSPVTCTFLIISYDTALRVPVSVSSLLPQVTWNSKDEGSSPPTEKLVCGESLSPLTLETKWRSALLEGYCEKWDLEERLLRGGAVEEGGGGGS
ncbi:hypothetical protein E2C01_050437 [Portunus trituberculatus]|uniref:Uncharacterized protein n=1 Tax=Portunus trituberculatus TaxID=210409 RepID=A0A5B7GGS3_PORTR|nr:hypothetical protein [Portunus trituberculatus]